MRSTTFLSSLVPTSCTHGFAARQMIGKISVSGRLLIGLTATLLFSALVSNVAQGQEPSAPADPWIQKKADRFKPLTPQQKQLIQAAVPDQLTARPNKPRRILAFFRCEGFIHGSIPHGNECLRAIAKRTNAFEVDFAETYDVFEKRNLAKYDAILLNNSSKMHFPAPEQQAAFMDFLSDGKGLIGIHAASDNFGRHPDCLALVGGIFAGHPWSAGGTWAFKLDDPKHILNQAFAEKGFWHQDEIYQYNADSYVGTGVLRVLVSLDMSKSSVSDRIDDGPREVPVSWIRTAGDGRVFYTNFGHRAETYQNAAIVRHLVDGIQYALGDLEADATPTDKMGNKNPALAPAQ